ncbi:MAG: hypothetical protein E4G95_01800 [Bacteroidia bacterium]|nr:MAG: hypothetical protein E4G95_01800 [Bacteroidia bacterium]
MIATVLEGFLLGLFLSVYIGPVFFLLIETSIKTGLRDAFIMDAGVIVSDLLWIILLYFGIDTYLGTFLSSPKSKAIAGAIFIMFGLSTLLKLKRVRKVQILKKRGTLFTKGFFLNTINPSVGLFWLATIAFAIRQFKNDINQIALFFISVFCTVIAIDAFKFFLAKKLSPFLNEQRQHRLSIITSIIMIIFGVYMISAKSR